MKQLPAPLEAWRPWLSLFPADLVEPLGELVLRLHTQIGPLRSAPSRADALPEGVGSIVQRGPYERLLITEWAYADAEPDEFIRRAASGELMFTGPEPAARQRSRRCVALFDAGPAQLGEPRLLHLALFILLARRAEEAGALFEWGVLQSRAALRTTSGMDAIRSLLKARTAMGIDAEAMASWAPILDSAGDDVWIIGAHGVKPPFPVRGQVSIRRNLLTEQLDVSLSMHRAERAFSLALPPDDVGVRLLREPFEATASRADVRQPGARPSLMQPPRFGVAGSILAVPQLDGGVFVYHVPVSLKNVPGKPRRQPPPPSGVSILGAVVIGRNLASIVSDGDELHFKRFPTEAFASTCSTSPRPTAEHFRAPPQSARWLPTFCVKRPVKSATATEIWEDAHVLALDLDGQLVCWTRRTSRVDGVKKHGQIGFRTLARNVIGAAQSDQLLVFACTTPDGTTLHSWSTNGAGIVNVSMQKTGTQILFGDLARWPRYAHIHGLVALRCSDTSWWVGTEAEAVTIDIADGAKVLGVAASKRHSSYGLVVLAPHKRTIELRTRFAARVLVSSPEEIAQASLCPRTGNIAWIGVRTCRVFVQGLDEEKPYLQVQTDETEHAT